MITAYQLINVNSFLGTNAQRPGGTNSGGALGGGGFVNPNSNRGTNYGGTNYGNNNRGTNYGNNYGTNYNNRGTNYGNNYGSNNYYGSSNYARNNYWNNNYGSQAPTYYRSRNNFGGGYYSGGSFR